MIRRPGFDCCLNQSPSFLKIKLMHLLLIKPPFCSVLLTLHRLCLHWSTGAGCVHSLSLFNFHRSPVDSRLYHFLSRFCMLSVGNELHRQLTLSIHHLRSGTAEPAEWPMNWPCCKSLCFLIFQPPNSLTSWPYMKKTVEKYIPRTQKIAKWCPVYFNIPGLFSGWVFHLIHLKGSGLSMDHRLGWYHDLRIWMYWKSWNIALVFGRKCTITINWTISYCCNLPLKPFYSRKHGEPCRTLPSTVEIPKYYPL